jgi:cell division protein ZapA
MERGQGHLVQVEIYGQSYNLRGEGESGYIQDLAAYVDRKMREVSEATSTVDSLKVAILAALNIADELFRCREVTQARAGELAERAGELERLLDRVLMAS